MSDPARIINRPEPGYWLTRLVRGGIEVPAAIIRHHTTAEPGEPGNPMERSPFLAAHLNGEVVHLHQVWERRGREITSAEYEYRLRVKTWATAHAPEAPEANADRQMDLNLLPPVF